MCYRSTNLPVYKFNNYLNCDAFAKQSQRLILTNDAFMWFVYRSNNKIIKSASDLREYRGLELANKMKVMLISDPLTDKAAASMDVNIGMKALFLRAEKFDWMI